MTVAVALGSCLEPDELLALVEGGCEDATRRAALGHAARCESCRQAIAAVARAVRSELDDGAHDEAIHACAVEPPPATIGRHRIVRTLGRGGMGVVYEAFDPRLRRRIAIKRMHLGARELGPRLRREAQVLARLADPHVVAVLEAGPDWIAMELVEGTTLAAWQRGKPWRAIVAAYLQAARGLAAAHAVGVVHRDFKPHNVLVDRHGSDHAGVGRVRVADFGLAAAELERSEPAAATPLDAITTASGLVGTPAYMAPEQFLGRRADAASDQFAFCVALHEALAGQRPFAGDDVIGLCAAVLAGRRRERPRTRVPAAIWRVIDRGLQIEPRRRWPSMAALATALAQAGGRRHWGIVAAAGLALTAAIALAPTDRPACGSDDAITAVWNAARAQRVSAALLASGLEYAETTARTVAQRLDAYAEQWTQVHGELCRAHAIAPEAIECLDDRSAALGELLRRIEAGDREVVLTGASAVQHLPSARSCEHPGATTERSPAARALARELATERVTLPLHSDDSDLPRLEQLVARAQKLGDDALVAEAITLLGGAQAIRGHWDAAMPTLEDAYFRDFELGDDAAACEIARDLALGASWQGRPEEALRWARLASARATDPAQRADVAGVEGEVLFELGRPAEAELALAAALAPAAPSYARTSALTMLGQLRSVADRLAEADAVLHEAVALIEREAGPNHPDLARPLNLLAIVQIQRGEHREAIATLGHARALLAAQLGDHHPMVAHVLGNLALAQGDLGDHEGAYQSMLLVLEIFERSGGPRNPQLSPTLHNLAKEAKAARRFADALRHAEAALALDRELGNHEQIPDSLSIIGESRRALGDLPGALLAFEEFIALRREQAPDDDDELGWGELAAAEVADRLGHRELAEQHLQRGLACYGRSDGTSPGERARAERIAARLRHDDRAQSIGHLQRAWALLDEHDDDLARDVRDLGQRMELVATWQALGGGALAPWPTITGQARG
jgi:eukaryotic-like serine/threonine-protein kinase